MRPWSLDNVFKKQQLWAFYAATEIVGMLPTRDPKVARCHEVARVVAPFIGGEVVDGKYGMADHSWVVFSDWPKGCYHLIDPYAVGRLPMVQIVDALPMPNLYAPGKTRKDIHEEFITDMRQMIAKNSMHVRSELVLKSRQMGADHWWRKING